MTDLKHFVEQLRILRALQSYQDSRHSLMSQVLKADILVNLNAGTETQDSQNQWTEDMDVEVIELYVQLTFPAAAAALPSVCKTD